MKRILFTIQWYPSVLSANALCDQKIIRELVKDENYEITCLAYRIDNAPVEEIIDGVKVHRFVKSWWWNRIINAKQNKEKCNRFILRLDKLFLRMRQLLFVPIYPNMEPIACRKFAAQALRLHKQNNYDIVISEYHGHDSLYAGSALKKMFPDICFIAILWDPFSGKQLAPYLSRRYAEKCIDKCEKRILGHADHIIAMESSRSYHERHSVEKTYYDKFSFMDIPGLVKPETLKTSHTFIRDGMINIVYAGILSIPNRDPEYIISALNQTKQAEMIHMIFLCTGAGKDKLYTLQNSFSGSITISGYIPRDELSALYCGADCFLNLGGPNAFMVPSKIFEYLSYGKPIISTYTIDDDSSKSYLEKYPLALCIDQRKPPEEAAKQIDEFIAATLHKSVSYEEVEKLFWKNTPKAYKELLDSI